MKHFFIGTLSIALFVLSGQAQCQSENTAPSRKYCGSGFTENLVPDNIFGCEMTEACKIHDICYSKGKFRILQKKRVLIGSDQGKADL